VKSSRKSWLLDKAKTILLRAYNAFAVPGELALEYVQKYAPGLPVYALPNTVDESLFRDRVLMWRVTREEIRLEWNIPPHNKVLLLPARLRPEKGVMPFLHALASLPPSSTRNVTLLLVGDGPQREEIARWIEKHNTLDVRLMGHVSQDEMLKLYAVADSSVLPSLSEPNPLSVIESLWAGLPLLLSNCVGNWHETLVPRTNGWLFDPESLSDTGDTLTAWATTSHQELQRLGSNSAKIAEKEFATENVVNNFLNQVLSQRL
jgi:glycosyltransferase involved in cell wall biosynthesis